MNKFSAALGVAAVVATGLAVQAGPAVAATRCGCPVVYHHAHHRVLRRRVVYYREPIAPPRDEVIYDAGPREPVGPAWYGDRERYEGDRYDHPIWRDGADRDDEERYDDRR